MVLKDLWSMAPSICALFVLIGEISALHLNLGKCVCIPLWDFSESEVRDKLRRLIPLWSTFVVRGHGKYLGFQVGPTANNMEWDKLKFDILHIACIIKDLKLPPSRAMMLYQMLGVSKMQHVAQLRPQPSDILSWELSAQRMVVSGPGSWTPTGFSLTSN